MTKIQPTYEQIDDIPEEFRPLYSAQDEGGYKLTGVEGVMHATEHESLIKALGTERDARQKADKKLKDFNGFDVKAFREYEKRVPELQRALDAALEGKDEAINAAVEERLGPPLRERDGRIAALTEENEKVQGEFKRINGELTKRDFRETIVKNASKAGVQDRAYDDVIHRAGQFGWSIDDNRELAATKPDGTRKYSPKKPTDEVTIQEWFTDILPSEAPHLFKPTEGAGSSGGGGASPRKRRSEMSTKEKSEFVKQQGPEAFQKLPA